MHKISYALAKRFSQDPLKLTFANKILLEKINYPSVTLIIPKTFRNQKVFKPIATGKARYENSESDRTSSMSEKI